MSQSDGTARPFTVGLTSSYPREDTPPTRKASRCQIALGTFAGTQFRGEIECLLRRRLRTVALITLVPGVVFFVRNLLEPQRNAAVTHAGTCFLGGVVLLTAVLAGLLWGPRPL